ncbi:MCP four helix bundle domain-containing protein, partial [Aliarcobacter butzleri]|uniref:MCP four helix bundle domain-containing protein n=1 Tax=Aliarcobacter butzleri TaxID=28197 RepID=UPI003AF5252E
MNILKNLKVKSKLLLILMVFTVVAVTISWKGLATSSSLSSEITSIISTNVPRIQYANELTTALVIMQRVEKNAILAESEEETKKYIDLFKESEKRFDEIAKQLNDVASEKGKVFLKDCINNKEEYTKIVSKIFELTAKNNSQAVLLSQTEGKQRIDNCEKSLGEIVSLNKQILKEKDDMTNKLYESSRDLIIAISVIGILITVVLCLLISSMLVNALTVFKDG